MLGELIDFVVAVILGRRSSHLGKPQRLQSSVELNSSGEKEIGDG